MKITQNRLQRIIQEELRRILEQEDPLSATVPGVAPKTRPLFDDPIKTAKVLPANKDLSNAVLSRFAYVAKKETGLPPKGRLEAEVTVAANKVTSWKFLDDPANETDKKWTTTVLDSMKGRPLRTRSREPVPDGTYEVIVVA